MEIPAQPSECAIDSDAEGGVCSSADVLGDIAQFVVDKGARPKTPVQVIEDAKDITDCTTESCVIRRVIPRRKADRELEERFLPAGPRNTFALLNNYNVDDVLDQLARKYSDFYHIGFQMIDFETVKSELAKIDFAKKIDEGYKRFGCIVNTDFTNGPGIHWFCLFLDFTHRGTPRDPHVIEYFNSSGNLPMSQIQIWAHKMENDLSIALGQKVVFKIASRIRHQNDEHSCGVYSLYYIWSRLSGIPFEKFRAFKIDDRDMHTMRKHLFRDAK
jgi:hypothetical protein